MVDMTVVRRPAAVGLVRLRREDLVAALLALDSLNHVGNV